jgi:uncharacterized membrane protein
MVQPRLVAGGTKDILAWTPIKKKMTFSEYMHIFSIFLLCCIPILLYYFYKHKTTRKEKEKKIKEFVKYVKVNTKKM